MGTNDPKELRRQIMSPNEPKTAREWWAQREIERLQRLLSAIRDEVRGCCESVDELTSTDRN